MFDRFSYFTLRRVERFLPENDDDRDLIDVTYDAVTRFAFRSGRLGSSQFSINEIRVVRRILLIYTLGGFVKAIVSANPTTCTSVT